MTMPNKHTLVWALFVLSLGGSVSAFTVSKRGVSLSVKCPTFNHGGRLYSDVADSNEADDKTSVQQPETTAASQQLPTPEAAVESNPAPIAAEPLDVPSQGKGSFLPRPEYYGEMAMYDRSTLEAEFIEREQVVSETSDKHFVIHPAPTSRVAAKGSYQPVQARDQYYGEMAMESGSTLDLEFTTNPKVVSETSDKNYVIPREEGVQGEYQRPQARDQYYGEMAMESGSTLDLEFTTNKEIVSETSDKHYVIPREEGVQGEYQRPQARDQYYGEMAMESGSTLDLEFTTNKEIVSETSDKHYVIPREEGVQGEYQRPQARDQYYGEMAMESGSTLDLEFTTNKEIVSETSDKHYVIPREEGVQGEYQRPQARDQYYGEMAMESGSTLDLEFTTNKEIVSETSDKHYVIPREEGVQGEYQRPQARDQYYGEMAMESGSTLDLEFTTNPKVVSETSDKNYVIPREEGVRGEYQRSQARDQYYGEMAMESGSTLDLEFTTNPKVVSETSDKSYVIPRDEGVQGEYQRSQARDQYYGEMAMESGSTLDLEFTTNPKVVSETSDKNYIIPRESAPPVQPPLPEPKMKMVEPEAVPETQIPEPTIPEPTIPEVTNESAEVSRDE